MSNAQTIPCVWYRVEDISIIMGVKKTKAYEIIKKLREEIEHTRIPGSHKCYAAPPRGQIRKSFFCEKYMLDPDECDRIIQEVKNHGG